MIKKIFHIHTDPKFINDSSNFDFEDYNNTIIYIGDSTEIKNQTSFLVIYIPDSLNVVNKISEICKVAQMVILYDLSAEKIALANKLPKDVKILWRFFGHELYGRIQKHFLSSQTIKLLNQQKLNLFYRVKISFLFRLKRFIQKIVLKHNYNFEQALKRIDVFLGLFEEEYKLLNTYFEGLPEFVQIPIFKTEIKLDLYENIQHKDKLIIGNSRNIYNNHMEILELTQKYKNLNLILPFSYGIKSFYSTTVYKTAKKQGVKVISDFMPYKAYINLLKESAAFVLNSYRQMAVGNVLIAIKNGTKIYLNKKNSVYKILKDRNFHVFTIEDFKKDLGLKNTSLSNNEVVHNFKIYNSLCKEYTLEDFKNKLEEKTCN